MPSSSTRAAAGPSSTFACSSAVVVSGQMVVHFGSLKETTTTLPRNERSDTRLPNWSVSVKPGAAPLSRVPGSSCGFRLATSGPTETGPGDELEERSTATAAPIPMPRASAAPSTIKCSRRDTPAQYGSGQIRSRAVAVSSSLSANGIHWDLSDLEPDAEQARRDWDDLLARARDFAERRRGTIGAVGAAGLRELLDELDELTQEVSRVHFYATAREHTDATDPETNDLATLARDRAADLESILLFVELEWLALEDAEADALLESAELEPYRHRLRVSREEKPYVLSEGEEQALNARRPALAAWESLHGRELATLTVEFDGGDGPEPHTIDRLLSYVHHPARGARRPLRRARGDRRRAGGLLRRARRRPALHRPPPRDPRSDVADEPAQRARRGRRRDDAAGRRGALSPRPPLVCPQRRGARARPAPARRPVRARGHRPPRRVAGGGHDGRGLAPRLRPPARRHLPRLPRPWARRRRAAPRQGRRRLLQLGLEGRPAVRPPQLHRPAPRRRHARARVRPCRARDARARAPDLPLVPHRARARGGPVDVRTAPRRRAVDRARGGSRDPGPAPRGPGRGRDGVHLPADDDGAVRDPRLRGAQRGEGADPRAAVGHLDRGERALLRRLDRASGGLPARLVVHPALHPRPLLHVRLRVRASRRVLARGPLPRGSQTVRARLPRLPRERRVPVAAGPARAAGGEPPRPAGLGARVRRVRPVRERGRGRPRRASGLRATRRGSPPAAAVPVCARRCRLPRRG